MLVTGHDLLNRPIYLLLLAARGERVCEQQSLFFGFLDGLSERAHSGYCRIKFTLTIKFFGVSECREQFLQLIVFNRGQVAVRIHRQDQKIEQCPLLGGCKASEANFHSRKLPDIEDNFKAQEPIAKVPNPLDFFE
jgi:hypothetical protein